MLTAWFYGDHKEEGLMDRLGVQVIRLGQTQEQYGRYTHVEAIHGGTWDDAVLSSASVRDGRKVRTEAHVRLSPGKWSIWNVPLWDRERSVAWFREHRGKRYSMLGAAASAAWPVRAALGVARVDIGALGQWCSRSVGESEGVAGAVDMSVSELAAHVWSLPGTEDVTVPFFGGVIRG
ncbi:MAG: hypothetical protein JNK17_02165 [Hydrogenophaga sp.]|nr:hypothetical protein [Hydrogenophaga sp.]